MISGRHLLIASVSLAGVLTLFSIKAEQWTWLNRHDRLSTHIPQLSVEFLPIPFIFLLWLRIIEYERPLRLRLSFMWIALSLAAYGAFSIITRIELRDGPIQSLSFPREFLFGTGVIAGLFVAVSLRECLSRMWGNPKLACVAIIAASSAFAYYRVIYAFWEVMCGWTANAVFALLRLFGAYVQTAQPIIDGEQRFIITSPWFGINVYIGCSGFEGIFLFTFMLSLLFLCDWEYFKNRRIFLFYTVGAICIFLVNVLRITAFFTVGYWAHNPNAPEWLHELQGAPVHLFHSYAGWIFYLVDFLLFTLCIHRKPPRQKPHDASQ